jgi:zinc protease
MSEDFTRLQLENGLTVLLKEIHTAPIISHWVWYRVGSRDETPGKTGISHWVEHMQFKGTQRFPAGVLDKAISRGGGYWNAMTYLDWTTYYETMPADQIDLALELEADRMVNSLFDPREVESERTVIISERQGNENEPLFRLGEEIQTTAFQQHPYGHETIGNMADLHTIQRDDLYRHYRQYYTPANAIVALAGDFETAAMLEQLKRLYAVIPAGGAPVRVLSPEPAPTGEKQVTVRGPGETTYVQLAYHVPSANHPDFLPLTVLDSLLCGPSSLNLFGGGISNKTSRLYRALVDKELAVSVSGGLQATIDPFLYNILLTIHPSSDPEAALRVTEAEFKRLKDSPPPAEELARAVKQARALFAYGSESISNQAFWLGYAEMFADYNWFRTYLERLEAVTPQDVQRAAQQYLLPENRVLGIYLPTGEIHDDE